MSLSTNFILTRCLSLSPDESVHGFYSDEMSVSNLLRERLSSDFILIRCLFLEMSVSNFPRMNLSTDFISHEKTVLNLLRKIMSSDLFSRDVCLASP